MNRIPPASASTTRVSAGWLGARLPGAEWDVRPDAELVDRFARYAEPAAFEALLRRHGPLVWGVCRRALINPADVEDAFQATFLVFVRKAGSVARGERVGPWLYGVAYRVARRVRERAARVPTCEPEAAAMLPDRPAPAEPADDWLQALDGELQALPAKYREPLILCELQGLTRKTAAERLRLREGTLSSRLARGRELLRKRLLKHGTLLPAGGLAGLLESEGVTRAGVPAGLLARTVTALTGTVPGGVAKLTHEVMTGMFLTRLRSLGALVVALAGVTAGLVGAAGLGPDAGPDQEARRRADGTKGAATAPPGVPEAVRPIVEGDLATLQGVWLGERVLEGGSIPAAPVPWGRCVVRGDVLWLLPDAEHYSTRWEVRLTPGRNPKWIDLVTDGCQTYQTEQVPGAVSPGVYRVTAAGWELALPADRGRLRPSEFETDDRVVTVRFRRPPPPRAGATPDAGRALEGRWAVTRQAYPHDDRSAMVDRAVGAAEIHSGHVFVQRPTGKGSKGFVWQAAEYSVDPTKEPRWIDLRFAGKASAGDASGYGVYELADDALRIAYRVSAPRSLRTLEFKAGIDDPLPAGGGPGSAGRRPACSLLELKRLGPP